MARRLEGKTVVLGVSGGIACYKAAEIVRLLRTAGARVRVVMTRHAAEFVTPLTMQTLSGEPVATDLFDLTQESEIGHIRLADSASVVVVAPATANLVAKAAAGIADDLLSTVLVATRAPVLLAPSMNVHMFENDLVQANLEKLRQHGFRVLDPGIGYLACGYEGAGRLAEPEDIVGEVERTVGPMDLGGERVLVTAGPSREPIDPVRFVSNRSSGKMGYALARAAWRRGAEVVLVSGPTGLAAPYGVCRVSVSTAAEMREAVLKEFGRATIALMAAAVADYRPAHPAEQKLKKTAGPARLDLERTVDVLAELGARRGRCFLVGFAAETENLVANAERKLREKSLDLIVANDVSRADSGFETDTNEVVMIDPGGRVDVPLAAKEEVAERILDRVLALRGARPTGQKSAARRSPDRPPRGGRRRS
jgi:phosphopantothenoylcysteine decarboxylase/phosphopantothenate--cysteine ligase